MITVVPFKREHLWLIEPQRGQRVSTIPADRHKQLEEGWSFTALDEQGRVIMCAGALPDDDAAWWAWAILSRYARRKLLALTRAILWIIRSTPADNVRMAVQWTFVPGHNWAKLLGFSPIREVHRIGGVWYAIYERGVRYGS